MQENSLIPEKNASRINDLINHESIKRWVCGPMIGVLDATVLVENGENIFFVAEHGGCGFIKNGENSYELHSFALPSGRGRWVRDNFFRVRDWIFSNTNASMITTMVPVNNKMALGAARICGFKKYGTTKDCWTFDGNIYDIDSYVLYKEVK